MTVKETAEYLRMCPMTIYRMAKNGTLPCFKVGDEWRFRREAIEEWIFEQENIGYSKKRVAINN
jgi:excisionase family DNA binding protein